MKVYEKVINALAGIAFLALVPVGLAVFNINGPLDFLQKQLGFWGSPTFLLLVFYGLTIVRILFGHAELYAPLLIGVLMSFLLICLTVPVSFMGWYTKLLGGLELLGNTQLIFLVALLVIGLAVLLSSLKKFPMIAQLLILVVLPMGVIVAFHYLGIGNLQELLKLPPPRTETP